MKGSRVLRVAGYLIPARWRATVTRDLEDEARGEQRGLIWFTWQCLRIGLLMRASFGVDAVATDARQVVRSLFRSNGFSAAAILTFALGIGANIAVFSVFDRLLFRPLPYAEPGRLVQLHLLYNPDPKSAAAMMPGEVTANLIDRAQSFTGIGWTDGFVRSTVQTPGDNPLAVVAVTSNTLSVVGVRPVLGRDFVAEDADSAGAQPVLLAYETWQARFGGSDNVLSAAWGRDPGYRVIGVLPKGFLLPSSRFFEHIDGLVVLTKTRVASVMRPGAITVAPFARLRADVSVEAAQAEVRALMSRASWQTSVLQSTTPNVTVQPLQAGLTMLVRPYLWLIASAVWVVLAVACVNLATLLLARGRSRHQESAVRTALGASTRRLVGLALLEAVVLCGISSMVALLICVWTQQSLMTVVPPNLREFSVTPLDPRIIAITIAVAFVSAAAATVLPTLNIRRLDVMSLFRRAGAGARVTPLRSGAALLAVEAALAVALVVGASGTVPGFLALLLKSPGFDASDLFIVSVNHGASANKAEEIDARGQRVMSVLDVIRAMPHVESAAAALAIPFRYGGSSDFWKVRGMDGSEWAVGARMFETLRTPMLAGRGFSDEEQATQALVSLVNETGMRALWPGRSPASVLGSTVRTNDGERRVVGVVADLRSRPGEAVSPSVFLPITAREANVSQSPLPVVLRMEPGSIPDRALLGSRLNEAFGSGGGVEIESVSEELAPWLDRPRFLAVLFGTLATIALLLAALGLYAVASFEMSRRRHEMGVRLALGASPHDLRRHILRITLRPVVFGTAAGALAIWLVVRLASASVPELSSRDPWTYGAAVGLVLVTAALVVWPHARRAARLRPAVVLRQL
jgi:putative ABC transport system permease protein